MSFRISEYDLPRIIFGCLSVLCMLLMSLWILRPFLLSVVWAGLVVIATWPVMLRFQGWMGGRRAPAVLSMVLLLIAFFVLPLLFMTGSLLDVSAKASAWFSTGQLQAILTPEMIHKIPVIGPRLYLRWQGIIADHGQGLLTHLQPWVRGAAITLIGQLGHLGQRLVSGFLMLAFSALFYVSGETVAKGISLFAHRLAGERGAMAVTLTGQTVKAVASGIVVTAVCQSVLGGIGLAVCGVPDAMLLTIVIFVLCLAQLGPLVVMLPATVWMYWQGMAGWASVLIVWSLAVGSMDNILRPMLIRRGADLPMTIILSGVIGGLLAFGMIGLFIGPAVLAVSWRLLVAWVSESGSPAVNVQ